MMGLTDFLKSSSCYTLRELRLNNNGLGVTGGKVSRSALWLYKVLILTCVMSTICTFLLDYHHSKETLMLIKFISEVELIVNFQYNNTIQYKLFNVPYIASESEARMVFLGDHPAKY